MKKFKIGFFFLSISMFLFTGCSQRVLDFTLISTKNIDLSGAASFERVNKRVSGRDKIHIICFIPTGVVSIKEAVDKAIESTPGCVALLDGVIYSKFYWIPYIYGQSSATVEGTPLIDPKVAVNANDILKFGKIELDKHGEIVKVEKISSTEYYAFKDKMTRDSKATRFKDSVQL